MRIIGGNRQWQCDNDCYQLLHDDVYAPFPPSSITHTHTHTHTRSWNWIKRLAGMWIDDLPRRRGRKKKKKKKKKKKVDGKFTTIYDYTCTKWLMRRFAFIITYASFPIPRLHRLVDTSPFKTGVRAWNDILYRVLSKYFSPFCFSFAFFPPFFFFFFF